MSTETRAAFARRIGVNKSTITGAAQRGRIVLNVHGLVEVEASLKRWHETKGGRSDVEERHAQNRGGAIPEAGVGEELPAGSIMDATGWQPGATHGAESEGRARHKAAALDYENKSIRLEMDLRDGRRYPIEAVKREGAGIGATLRAAFERLTDQTAPRLAVMPGAAERSRLLRQELARVRQMIKTDLPRALRRLREIAAGKTQGGGA